MKFRRIDLIIFAVLLLSIGLFFRLSNNGFSVESGKIEEDGIEGGMKRGFFVFTVFSMHKTNCTSRIFLINNGKIFCNCTRKFSVKPGRNLIKVKIPLPEGKNRVIGNVRCR